MNDESATLADLQRSMRELGALVQGHISTTKQDYLLAREDRLLLSATVENVAKDLATVKIGIALMTGKFLGGWRVLVVIGGIVSVVGAWIISLRFAKGFP